jgi:hypothetical protein
VINEWSGREIVLCDWIDSCIRGRLYRYNSVYDYDANISFIRFLFDTNWNRPQVWKQDLLNLYECFPTSDPPRVREVPQAASEEDLQQLDLHKEGADQCV